MYWKNSNHCWEFSSAASPVDLHLSVESIVEKQVVGHSHTVGLHWVTLRTIIIHWVTMRTIIIHWVTLLRTIIIAGNGSVYTLPVHSSSSRCQSHSSSRPSIYYVAASSVLTFLKQQIFTFPRQKIKVNFSEIAICTFPLPRICNINSQACIIPVKTQKVYWRRKVYWRSSSIASGGIFGN